jgi:hypothetical protein
MAKRKKFTEKAKVKLLTAFQASRLTAREFCNQQGIAASSFSAWRKRLAWKITEKVVAAKEPTAAQQVDFIPVTLIEVTPTASCPLETAHMEPVGTAAFEMLLPSGSSIRFAATCPSSLVAAVFAAIAV